MRILVVDDDADFADGMAEMLSMLGHDSHSAISCDDGIAALDTGPFDLALIDIGLAGRSGAECARELGKISDTLVCVLMTGYSTDALTRMGIPIDEFDILRKPIKPETLDRYLTD